MGRTRHRFTEVVTEQVLTHARRLALPRHRPALQDEALVGELQGPVDVLLDHQDRHAGLARPAEPLEDRVDEEGARPSESSSAISSVGEVMRARASESICCSPPERLPATCRRRAARLGKNSNARSMASRRARRPCNAASPSACSRSPTASGIHPVPRADGSPRPGESGGADRGDVRALERHAPGRGGDQSRRWRGPGCSCRPRWGRARPAPVPAGSGTRPPTRRRPARSGRTDPRRRGRAPAVASRRSDRSGWLERSRRPPGAPRRHRQAAVSSPRYAARTWGSRRISSGVPLAMRTPKSST